MKIETPTVLYKFRPLTGNGFRYTQDLLTRNRLYLAGLKQLNDPFEGVVGFQVPETVSHAERLGHTYADWLHRQLQSKLRLCSLAATIKSRLLWSHYADGHKGIAIGVASYALRKLADLRPVVYSKRAPQIQIRAREEMDDDDIRAAFSTKSIAWKYEREWRVFGREEQTFVKLPHGAIKEVVLGARIPDEDVEWVLEWVARMPEPPKIRYARASTTSFDVLVSSDPQNRESA
jgi:hypothetical protein